ncbi:MAG: DUF2336 domain-containing protein [Aestuariivirga sp.]|nr:DUF2336 domain-containing protein [Aestuariivirga sp.]
MAVIVFGSADCRVALARQLACFLADPETPPGEREQVLPVVRRLAVDADPDVRYALAEALVSHETLDNDLFFTIVSDDEDIALPFLSWTPALDTLRMLAILRAGDEARQAVIAMRPDVSAEAADVITRELPLAVNVLLLENPDVGLDPSHFRALYQRFAEDQEMLSRLLARPDLPLILRIAQARRAASSIHQLLTERDWLSSTAAAELVIEAEENAVFEILAEAGPDDLQQAVAFLIDNGMLTPALVVHAACQGAMQVVAECLAGLSGVPLRRVEVLIHARGKVRAVFVRSGLPQSCHWILQAACDVAADEREDGLRLTPDEFGARIIQSLLTRYEAMPLDEQPRNLDVIGRYAGGRTRHLASRLRADLQRAA